MARVCFVCCFQFVCLFHCSKAPIAASLPPLHSPADTDNLVGDVPLHHHPLAPPPPPNHPLSNTLLTYIWASMKRQQMWPTKHEREKRGKGENNSGTAHFQCYWVSWVKAPSSRFAGEKLSQSLFSHSAMVKLCDWKRKLLSSLHL